MTLTDSKLVKKIDTIIAELKGSTLDEERSVLVSSYLETFDNDSTKIPDFDENLEWLNCKNPLSFKEQLRGKICVLDFFTYCCINCMHILPDLEALEHQHSEVDGLVIIGVHSAKFDNEKSSTNIWSAILRYNISHAVVNDAEAKMWHTLGVACWPTLVVVGPSGELLLSLVGEGHRETLTHFIGAALKYYKEKDKISDHTIGIVLAKDELPKTRLSFPGKVCTDESGGRLVVADTGHHRILVMSVEGITHHVIGGGEMLQSGFKDGAFAEARFHAPQGVVMIDEEIYVADTENHAIRKIDLKESTVSTVAGTGQQGNDKEGGSEGKKQPISSPWDVLLGPPPGSKAEKDKKIVLYIAMAGTHQIWALYLEDGSGLKGSFHKAGTCIRFAGSGNESNHNNSYPHKAAFAQPSGLALAFIKTIWCLFVADSESSSVRMVDITTGATKAVVGADRDPNNLFAFGDVDGKAVDVKLQHPLGVAWNCETKELFLADSYNHKIKKINPSDKTCTSYLGNGKPSPDHLDEPGGLCISLGGQRMYVADTNNNIIRVIDLTNSQVTKLTVIDQESHQAYKKLHEQTDSGHVTGHARKRLTSKRTPVTQHQPVRVTPAKDLEVKLNFALPRGCLLTEGATSKWQACWVEDGEETQSQPLRSCFNPSSGVLTNESLKAVTMVTWPDASLQEARLMIEAVIYYCEPSGTCRMQGVVYHIPLVADESRGHHSGEINTKGTQTILIFFNRTVNEIQRCSKNW